ncbi:hypothetical protein BH09GEM1_BH09GEM1_06540 [soil metagenome]
MTHTPQTCNAKADQGSSRFNGILSPGAPVYTEFLHSSLDGYSHLLGLLAVVNRGVRELHFEGPIIVSQIRDTCEGAAIEAGDGLEPARSTMSLLQWTERCAWLRDHSLLLLDPSYRIAFLDLSRECGGGRAARTTDVQSHWRRP